MKQTEQKKGQKQQDYQKSLAALALCIKLLKNYKCPDCICDGRPVHTDKIKNKQRQK